MDTTSLSGLLIQRMVVTRHDTHTPHLNCLTIYTIYNATVLLKIIYVVLFLDVYLVNRPVK